MHLKLEHGVCSCVTVKPLWKGSKQIFVLKACRASKAHNENPDCINLTTTAVLHVEDVSLNKYTLKHVIRHINADCPY